MIEYVEVDGEITEDTISSEIEEIEIDCELEEDAVRGTIDSYSINGDIDTDQNVEGGIQVAPMPIEVDPTVPDWAKQPEKPDYEWSEIEDKPAINGVTLIKDKSIEQLGVNTLTNREILEIFNRVFRR